MAHGIVTDMIYVTTDQTEAYLCGQSGCRHGMMARVRWAPARAFETPQHTCGLFHRLARYERLDAVRATRPFIGGPQIAMGPALHRWTVRVELGVRS